MKSIALFAPASRLSAGLLAIGTLAAPLAQAADLHVAPAITQIGKNLGGESPSTPLVLTAWLNLHNRAELDARVAAIYDPASPTFHKWLTNDDLKTYAPTAAEVAAVQAELKAHNLDVQSVDPLNFSVRFTGNTADVESAFGTQIGKYTVKGELTRAATSQPRMGGAAAGLLQHLSGLNTIAPKLNITFPRDPRTGKAPAGIPVQSGGAKSVVFSSQCFFPPSSAKLFGVNANGNNTPAIATYTGLVYGADPNNTAPGTLPSCGYSAAQIQGFYGLDTAFNLGYTGTGETIVLIDAYQEPTIQADAATYSTLNKLPPITSANFKVYTPYGANELGSTYGVDIETELDVELAHATAPGANLALVLGFSENEEDIQSAILYAVTNSLGNVISVSYGYPEYYTGPLATGIFSQVVELGAAKGIAVNVSSGDAGDDTIYGGPATVESPADSPYATAVGGTSVGTAAPGGPVFQTGWGNNTNLLGYISKGAQFVVDPPVSTFYAGSGGGISAYFPKPAYQSGLPGPNRHIPDVSAIADPYTGAEYVYTDVASGKQMVSTVGGTSLAAPVFSGIWTIADEYFGRPLGQAAPYVAATVGSFITDVVPFTGPANVSGTILDPAGTTTYSATALSQPLATTTEFTSALWNAGAGVFYNITFGTDSSLTVTQGWDNVTGYGTPNIGTALKALNAKPKQ